MAATAGCLWSWGTAPLAAGEVLDADPGWGSSSLLLDSFQKLITAIKVPGRSTHPPAFWVPRPRPPRAITTTCSQFPRSRDVLLVPSCAMAETPSGRHHKPRRKVKQNGDGKGFQLSKAETLVRAPSFPLSAFLWPARGSVSQWEVLPLILMVVGLFRWAAGLWGYSGEHQLLSCKRA